MRVVVFSLAGLAVMVVGLTVHAQTPTNSTTSIRPAEEVQEDFEGLFGEATEALVRQIEAHKGVLAILVRKSTGTLAETIEINFHRLILNSDYGVTLVRLEENAERLRIGSEQQTERKKQRLEEATKKIQRGKEPIRVATDTLIEIEDSMSKTDPETWQYRRLQLRHENLYGELDELLAQEEERTRDQAEFQADLTAAEERLREIDQLDEHLESLKRRQLTRNDRLLEAIERDVDAGEDREMDRIQEDVSVMIELVTKSRPEDSRPDRSSAVPDPEPAPIVGGLQLGRRTARVDSAIEARRNRKENQ